MRGSRSPRTLVFVTAFVVGMSGVVPAGALRDQRLPIDWLWSWLRPHAAWGASAFIGVPVQPSAGGAAGRPHYVPAEATRAGGGSGTAPGKGIGALDPYTPPEAPLVAQTTTPALTGEHSFDPARSTRVAAEATASSDVYSNPDGSFTRRVYAEPVNFSAPDGSWRPIDRTLVRGGDGRLRPRADSTDLHFAGRADGASLATIRLGGHRFEYSLVGAKPVAGEAAGETVTYREVLPGTDLKLSVQAAGVKGSIVLRSADAATSWVFPLRLRGLTPRLEATGEVTLRDFSGAVQVTIPKGYMEDSRFDDKSGEFTRSWGVHYALTTADGQPALKVSADQSWLRDPARVFPVTVDPTTNFITTGDTFARNDWPGDNGGSNELLAGTYNGGTSKAHSFIAFGGFTSSYGGAKLSAASLRIFLSWAGTCTPKPFTVHPVTTGWTEAGVTSYPGPSFGGSIGSATPDPGPACTNTGGDRNIGVWVTVPLGLATIQNWANGGTNHGLAVTASQTDSLQWKRFTSRNGPAGKGPYLQVTYAPGVLPQVNAQYPSAGYVAPTLTPELLVAAHDPDNWPGALTYDFLVYNSAGTKIAESGWIPSRNWLVPAGLLKWGESYSWTVGAKDGYFTSTSQRLHQFSTPVPQPLITSALAQNSGRGFEPSIGNYTTSARDAVVPTVGPALQVDRSYNSQDPRTGLAFGAGWSSMFDAKAREQRDAGGVLQTVIVTYPGGQDVAFGRNTDGSFAPAPGRFANFATVTGGYRLVDKDGTTYMFTGPGGGISSISDAQGRTLTFTYDTSNRLSALTSASGRRLHVGWTVDGRHVERVFTDPVTPGDWNTAITWLYTYSGDLLTKVCSPVSSVACTTYQYGTTSLYPSAIQNAGPRSYWRLGDSGGTMATSAVLDKQGTDSGIYTSVALGQPGPLPGSAALAAGFTGASSSRVQLPSKLVTSSGYQTISLWFKTTAAQGVLFSYQADPITNPTTPGNYTPSLYVGASGRLYGEFWYASGAAPIVTANPVNDGNWHQAVLAAAGNTQSLYLDGNLVGTKTGLVQMINAASVSNIYLGGGFLGSVWPDHSHVGQDGHATFFNGSIAEVGFFDRALTAPDVAAIHAVGKVPAKPLTSIVRPSGNPSATIAYDAVTGAVTQVTDAHGGVWKVSAPTVSGSSQVYAGAVLSGAPADYWRLAETGTTDAINEVNGSTATYSAVTLGATGGPFADTTVAGFNGASSYLKLPVTDAPGTGPASVSMWFKMPAGNTGGGVLYSYQNGPVQDPAATTNWVPALYVGVDGKLRGHFWVNDITKVMTSPGTVNDGNWHHVMLAASNNSQSLYLDGARVAGPVSAPLMPSLTTHVQVGAGKWASWPGRSAAAVGYFPGQIAEVAFYRSQLGDAHAGTQFAARDKSTGAPAKTIRVTDPGSKTIEHVYEMATGRQLSEVDSLGNKTQFGYDVAGFLRTVTDPSGNVTTSEHDVRGNVVSQTTCQDRSANKCSTVYYTYYPDATSKVLAPDPRNDVLLTVRDGRSASATDNTYLMTHSYDIKGNRTSVTDPLGRATVTEYTADGLPAKMTTPGWAVQTVEYHSTTRDITKITDPAGKVITFSYDGVGRVLTETEITDRYPGGLTTGYQYDGLGRVVRQTEPAVTNRVTGAVHTPVTATVYDADGNTASQTVSDSAGGDAARTESSTYNVRGQQVVSTDAAGKITRFEYDVYGNVVKEIEPDGGVTTSAYDAEGNLLTTTVVGFTGDPNNPSPAHDVVMTSKAYDPAGRLASVTDAMGWVTSYTYTDNGLTAKVTRTDPSTGASFVLEQNSYDAAGNLTSQMTGNGATTTSAVYDAAGRTVASTLDPAGLKRTTSYEYSRDDQVVRTTLSEAPSILGRADVLYDIAGRPLARSVHRSLMAPAGRWRFNETSGTTAADSGGNSKATASNVTWSTAHGGSAVFNGTSSYVATAGPVLDTARSFTVTAWAYPTDATRNRAVVAQEGNSENGFYLKYDHLYGDKWSLVMYDRDDPASPHTYATSTTTATLNAWTHLVAVYDAPAKLLKLYVNGVLQTTNALNAGHVPWSSYGPLTVGRLKFHGNPADPWAGSISDLQAYSRVLSDAEISGVYAGTAPAAGAGVSRESWTYDQDGLEKSMTDPNGDITDYDYDEDGERVVTISPPVQTEPGDGTVVTARPTTFAGYNTFGEQVEVRDARGNVTVTEYDPEGRVTKTRLPSYTPPGSSTPLNPIIENTYGTQGQLTSTKDGVGDTTRYDYDQLGRVAKVIAPNLGESKFTYDLLGNRLSSVDPVGAVDTVTYDYLGRVATSTEVIRQTGASHTTTYTYGLGGWLTEQRSPAGVVTKVAYNAAGQPINTTDGANNVTSYEYDGVGRTVKTKLPGGTYTVVTYDLAGREVATRSYDAAGVQLSSHSTEYDAEGNLVASTDARGTRITFKYDTSGMIVSETQPISATNAMTTSFGYDANGNRTRFTDGRGSVFQTTYNSWNLPESQFEPATVRYPNATDRTFTTKYDAAGRVAGQMFPGGVTVTNTHDPLGNITRQTGTGAEVSTVERTFGYDPAGRMTSASAPGGANTFGYEDRGLLTSTTGPSGAATFAYTPDGFMATRTDAAGTTNYSYDTAGRVAGVSNPTTGVQLSYAYNALSLPSTITYGGTGNRRTLGYDGLHRPTSDELKTPGGATIGRITYGYDANGNETSKTTTGFTGSATNTYTYDLADRLTSWNTVTYAYDKSGNRTQAGAKQFTYDERNQLIAADGATHQYTPRGTLSTVTSGSTVQLTQADAFGQVTRQDSTGGTKNYSYDAQGRLIQPGFAYSGLDNTLAADAAAKYTRDADDDLLGVASGSSFTHAWTDLHTDVVGQFTATGTTLAGSTTYDPLGTVLAATGMLGNLGYQSAWTDFATGRVNMWHRWYNTLTGQFDTRDPVDLDPIPDSVNANRFAYADDNPLTVTDVDGHWGFNPFKAVKQVATTAWRATTSFASRTYHHARHYVHRAFAVVKKVVQTVHKHVSRAYHEVKRKVSHAYKAVKRWVKHTYHKAKQWVKHTYHKAKRWVKQTYHKARKWVAHKVHQVKRHVAKVYHKVKQAGRKVIARTVRIAQKVGSTVKDAYNATEKWVKDHKNAIIEAVAIGGAILAGIACTAATAGAGAVACMVGAAAVINLAKDAAQGDIHNWGDAFGSLGTGAVQGLAGGAGGAIGGKVAGALAGKMGGFGGSLGGRMASGSVAGGVSDAVTQFATTGRIDLRGVAMSAGIGAVTGGAGRGRGRSSCHSFDPKTRVLMGDGTAKAIKDIRPGDKVRATDPLRGLNAAKTVTATHRNVDIDLTDLKVRSNKTGKVTTLSTTQHHPFWNLGMARWSDAKELAPGDRLKVAGADVVTVIEVRNWFDSKEMRDLTIDDFHTYYVLADTVPVLVHNNDGSCPVHGPAAVPGSDAPCICPRGPPGPKPRTGFDEDEAQRIEGVKQTEADVTGRERFGGASAWALKAEVGATKAVLGHGGPAKAAPQDPVTGGLLIAGVLAAGLKRRWDRLHGR